jgi:Fe-S-cluster containining protein
MEPKLTDALCTNCALCCDGSLFADVELAGRREATRLEILGLDVDDSDADGALLPLPCVALRGRRCSVYAHRPECCRTFECRLLQDARRGAVSVARAQELIAETLARIARVKELLAELGQRDERLSLKERCAEALAVKSHASGEVTRKRRELEAAMADVEKLIRKRFLGGDGSRVGTDPQTSQR